MTRTAAETGAVGIGPLADAPKNTPAPTEKGDGLWPVGSWLSAALDDPKVCDEMKRDIREWFDGNGHIRAAMIAATQQPALNPQDIEDAISDAIGDSMDMDWTYRDGAKSIMRAFEREGWEVVPLNRSAERVRKSGENEQVAALSATQQPAGEGEQEVCPACNGDGHFEENEGWQNCTACRGSGTASSEPGEVCWLVERGDLFASVLKGPQTHYLFRFAAQDGWTTDVHQATRFPTREAAEDTPEVKFGKPVVRAAEHVFGLACPAPTKKGDGLLPCPFCGGRAHTCKADGLFTVDCRDCCAGGSPRNDRDAAAAAWNTRAMIPATQQAVSPAEGDTDA